MGFQLNLLEGAIAIILCFFVLPQFIIIKIMNGITLYKVQYGKQEIYLLMMTQEYGYLVASL